MEILLAYLQARRALRCGPIASAMMRIRSQAGASCGLSAAAPTDGRIGEARRLGRAVVRTLRLVPGDTRCLVRSLVLARLLACRGIPAKLVIGARVPGFLAHAWVECAGDPVLPNGNGSFERLVEL